MGDQIAVHTTRDGLRLSLNRYHAFESHPAHRHTTTSASLVLAGALHEVAGGVSVGADSLAGVFKPANLVHGNRFGPNGALLIQIAAPRRVLTGEWAWTANPAAIPWVALALALLGQRGGVELDEAISAAVGAVRVPGTARAEAPPWLADVHDALRSDDAGRIGMLAARYGVHRVHLGRVFQSRFGLTPADFRARSRVARAVNAMWSNPKAPLAGVACETGFADQSHMTRAFQRWLGAAPAAFGRVLAAGANASGSGCP